MIWKKKNPTSLLKKKQTNTRFKLLFCFLFVLHKCKYYLTNSSVRSFHVTTRLGRGSVMGGLKSCYVLLWELHPSPQIAVLLFSVFLSEWERSPEMTSESRQNAARRWELRPPFLRGINFGSIVLVVLEDVGEGREVETTCHPDQDEFKDPKSWSTSSNQSTHTHTHTHSLSHNGYSCYMNVLTNWQQQSCDPKINLAP